jgi:hypothetical protein
MLRTYPLACIVMGANAATTWRLRRTLPTPGSFGTFTGTLEYAQVGGKSIGFVPDASNKEEQQPGRRDKWLNAGRRGSGMLVNGLKEQ